MGLAFAEHQETVKESIEPGKLATWLCFHMTFLLLRPKQLK
jgi:hypothetical protein